MNKLFIACALLSATASMVADFSKGHWSHFDKSGGNISKGEFGDTLNFKQSPEEMARLVKYLQQQTIMQPPRLMKKWDDLRADKIKLAALEINRQIIPQIDCPVKRAKYKKLTKTMMHLAHQLKALPIPTQPFKVSLESKPLWLALKGREAALTALQLMVVAKQTGTQELLKKAQHKLRWAKKIKHTLQLLEHQEQDGYEAEADHEGGYDSDYEDSDELEHNENKLPVRRQNGEDEAVYFVLEDQE